MNKEEYLKDKVIKIINIVAHIGIILSIILILFSWRNFELNRLENRKKLLENLQSNIEKTLQQDITYK